MTPETITWLTERMKQHRPVDAADETAVHDFAMLWSFFECTRLNCNASCAECSAHAATLLENVDAGAVDAFIHFLQKQYVAHGQFTQRFHALNFPYTPREVDEVLKGRTHSLRVKMTACLMLLSRFRHNLFHGEVWKDGLQGEQETFLRANAFLKALM